MTHPRPHPRFIVRPTLHPRESLPGFLMRIADLNGMPGVEAVLEVAALPLDYATVGCELGGLARVLDGTVDETALEAASLWPGRNGETRIRYGPHALSITDVDRRYAKVCPRCLDGDALARRHWHLRAMPVCPEHARALLDACPRCGARLMWSRGEVRTCGCGQDLREADTAPVEGEELELCRWLCALDLGLDRPEEPRFPPLDLASALRIVPYLGAPKQAYGHRLGKYDGERRQSRTVTTNAAMRVVSKRAGRALCHWPDRIPEWLDAQRLPVATGASMGGVFGPLFVQRLRRALEEPERSLVENAIAESLGGRVDGAPIKAWSRFGASQEVTTSGLIHATVAARRARMSITRMNHLIAIGEVKADGRPYGQGTQHLVHEDELKRFTELQRSLVDLRTAGGLLCSNKRITLQFVEAGLISTRAYPGQDEIAKVELRSIAELAHRLDAACGPEIEDPVSLERFQAAQNKHRIVKVVEAILAGRLAAARVPGAQCGNLLARYAISLEVTTSKRFRSVLDDEGLTARDAAKALGVQPPIIRRLVEDGVLQTVVPRTSDTGYYRITRASLARFDDEFVLASRLGEERGVRWNTILQRLEEAGLEPVVRSVSSKKISSVWRRTEALTAALNRSAGMADGAAMQRYALTDPQWASVATLLPCCASAPSINAPARTRLFVDRVLWMLRSGAKWRDFPEEFGNRESFQTRFARWADDGVWRGVFEVLARDPDNEHSDVDRAFIDGDTGVAGRRWGFASSPRSLVPSR